MEKGRGLGAWVAACVCVRASLAHPPWSGTQEDFLLDHLDPEWSLRQDLCAGGPVVYQSTR